MFIDVWNSKSLQSLHILNWQRKRKPRRSSNQPRRRCYCAITSSENKFIKKQKPPRHRKSFPETETHTHTHKRTKQKQWGFVCCSCNRSGTNSRPTKRFPIGKRCRFGSCFIIIATQHRPQLKQKRKINDRKQIRRTKRSTKISGDWSAGREERPLRWANLCFLSSQSRWSETKGSWNKNETVKAAGEMMYSEP